MTLPDLLHAFGVLALGALGWVTLAFVGSPVREFYTMRREVRRLMLLHWDDDYAEDWEGIDPEVIPNRRSARIPRAQLSKNWHHVLVLLIKESPSHRGS